jgi:hypothetical protein
MKISLDCLFKFSCPVGSSVALAIFTEAALALCAFSVPLASSYSGWPSVSLHTVPLSFDSSGLLSLKLSFIMISVLQAFYL